MDGWVMGLPLGGCPWYLVLRVLPRTGEPQQLQATHRVPGSLAPCLELGTQQSDTHSVPVWEAHTSGVFMNDTKTVTSVQRCCRLQAQGSGSGLGVVEGLA